LLSSKGRKLAKLFAAKLAPAARRSISLSRWERAGVRGISVVWPEVGNAPFRLLNWAAAKGFMGRIADALPQFLTCFMHWACCSRPASQAVIPPRRKGRRTRPFLDFP